MLVVLNHPAFRVPKESSWGWDPAAEGVQYRRVDRYLSESKEKIQTHPSAGSGQVPSAGSGRVPRPEDYTISFHRPLQFYFKAFTQQWLLHWPLGRMDFQQ